MPKIEKNGSEILHDMESLAEMLIEKRGSLSLRQAAKSSGISHPTLQRMEKGSFPDIVNFTRACKWLGVSPELFLGKCGETISTPQTRAREFLRRNAEAQERLPDRDDIKKWQEDQSEFFTATILEIVCEYAAWRDRKDAEGQEPVAWLYEAKAYESGLWVKCATAYEPTVETTSRRNIRPLYTRPANVAALEAETSLRDVIAERERQKSVEGWTPEHDDAHANGELARAAASYAHSSARSEIGRAVSGPVAPAWWPWSDDWWKPTTQRRDLVKAAALILAEIERLDRAALTREGGV